MNRVLKHTATDMKRHILAGIITAGPLFITWLVFTFILGVLANAGRPVVRLLAAAFPGLITARPWAQDVLAVLLTVAVFYVVGRTTSRVVGRQLFGFFEASLERLPLVNKVYTSVRQAVDTLTGKKGLRQRVVLVEFPHPGQKALAFLTHVIADSTTGTPIAAVLVPQAINPSSSYLQFVPMEKVVETDLTVEQAMSMLMTGGAVCPEVIRYSAPIAKPLNRDGTALPVSAAVQDPEVAMVEPAGNVRSSAA